MSQYISATFTQYLISSRNCLLNTWGAGEQSVKWQCQQTFPNSHTSEIPSAFSSGFLSTNSWRSYTAVWAAYCSTVETTVKMMMATVRKRSKTLSWKMLKSWFDQMLISFNVFPPLHVLLPWGCGNKGHMWQMGADSRSVLLGEWICGYLITKDAFSTFCTFKSPLVDVPVRTQLHTLM